MNKQIESFTANLRYLHHQNQIAGRLEIRLVEGKNLNPIKSGWWSSASNPYVVATINQQTPTPTTTARSSTIKGTCNPTWRKEVMTLDVPKVNTAKLKLLDESEILNVRAELNIDVFNEDSLTGKATECVGMQGGSLIGSGVIDFTELVQGEAEVLDIWVMVNESNVAKEKGNLVLSGEVRVIIQYEPHGMEPVIGDLIKLEGFGIHPTRILPPIEEAMFLVKAVSGNYILGSYSSDHDDELCVRLHRNAVYVVERGNLLDRVYIAVIATPLSFIDNTPLGQSCKKIVRPYANIIYTLVSPALTATRATLTTTYRASSAAISAIFAIYSQ